LKSHSFLKRCKVGDAHEARLLYDIHLQPHIPIHQGEAEVIIQARERQAAEVIIDDSDGREVAIRHSLNVRGTVRLLIELRRAEVIQQKVRPLVEKCRTDLGFRISNGLLDQLLKEIGE
jgi:predicted nucleic acid-binding protein